MTKYQLIKTCLFCLLPLLLQGCFMKMGRMQVSNGKQTKYHAVFSGDAETMTLFAKPEKFKSRQHKLVLDFTTLFRPSSDTSGVTTGNFTLWSGSPQDLETITLHTKNGRISKPLSKRYVEKEKGKWKMRYYFRLDFEEYEQVIDTPQQALQLTFKTIPEATFTPSGKWTKRRAALQDEIKAYRLSNS